MPQIKKALTVLAYADGFTLWHYLSDVPLKTALAEGYFNEMSRAVKAGDVVMITTRAQAVFALVKAVGEKRVVIARLKYKIA
ncbi:hypothetical protein FACS1894186_3210 [Alphaproteobacteria bacterium]|nr:hypothetical protein FACS1894186_3210 [Alphaproteobacteria bacterium]